MTKVRILKACKINGVPADPGEIRDVTEPRAKALTDNNYAELIAQAPAPAAPATAPIADTPGAADATPEAKPAE